MFQFATIAYVSTSSPACSASYDAGIVERSQIWGVEVLLGQLFGSKNPKFSFFFLADNVREPAENLASLKKRGENLGWFLLTRKVRASTPPRALSYAAKPARIAFGGVVTSEVGECHPHNEIFA